MIAGQPLACFQPFIDTATGRIAGVEALGRLRQSDGQLLSVGPLFADPKTPATALRQLDREIRGDALQRLHEAPGDWFIYCFYFFFGFLLPLLIPSILW